MALLEVACFSLESATLASTAGADRIELCANREAGGTTPPLEWLDVIKQTVAVPVYVMIRPRGGSFYYSEDEIEHMKHDIAAFKGLADGFVFGLLTVERRIDVFRTADLVTAASPLPCTFHKAFDEAVDAFEAFEDVIATGCQCLLTSGGASSAHAGIDTIAQLVRMCQGRITVMPGGGIRASNIGAVRAFTRASILHSSAVPHGEDRPSAEEIRRMKATLNVEGAQMPLHIGPPASEAGHSP
ncbi:hypothetical protein BAUCODRAFT_121132 [Baudoinia panamericana UAMH 10762]|uniref:Copper homeostasis protein cutC homolog n=1 Tax=Baudoinia panamericana (strain UAMH 10762) TaxID=717646 RepID=M2MNI5_BAUPA|nr:uncharacterized protein BAUCODRAFT_121132 [Baudoinia panamericana UAMH 10762]EMC98251.1 hypothetical protein BAUCODRAFT_121132 [Baudoinia panamericana UAMH 10762]